MQTGAITASPTAIDPESCNVRGVHRLAGAILLQAIEDVRCRTGKKRDEAMRWVEESCDEQFGFVYCCRMLHRDPDEVRRFLERRDISEWVLALRNEGGSGQEVTIADTA